MQNQFRLRSVDALNDSALRNNFRGAMDFLRTKRLNAFQDIDIEALRLRGAKIRRNVLRQLPDLLEQLETQCLANGISVHWAEDAREAREIIASIAQSNQVKSVVKGKSMASEEIDLNQHLAHIGIDCIETDMGEFIVQLDHEPPSHIIMPAIHKSKEEIAELFSRELGENTENASVDDLIGIGRKVMREKFRYADMGISGVNFAVAESGTLCLVENEGNGRMCTSVPNIHVALMGIEKVVPDFKSLPDLMTLLTASATGQIFTTYFNMISSPRKPGERDGPEQVHLVLLDNGRSKMYADEVLQETLACIRCGACMNHCPVYTKIGGHAYGSTYPGPIGQVVMPQIEGVKEKGDLLDACSLNGACGEACPVKIDLPFLIRTLRAKRMANKPFQGLLWQFWQRAYQSKTSQRALALMIKSLRLIPFAKPPAWTQTRTFPEPAKKTFSQLLKERNHE